MIGANQNNVLAVVTTQFMAKSEAPTVEALRAVSRLGVAGCLLLVDDKDDKGMAHAHAAIARVHDDLEVAKIAVDVQNVDLYSTARRWYPGLVKAFEQTEVCAALLFPGDLPTAITEQQIQKLRAMVDGAETNALQLADYQSKDSFKEHFDELVTWPILVQLFPNEVPAARGLGTSKMRTEIFVCGKRVFQEFRKNLRVNWGTDPTVQLVINTLRNPPLVVRQPVHLKEFTDDGETRQGTGQVLQIVRFATQMLNNRIIEEKIVGTGAARLADYNRLRDLTAQTFKATLKALDENRARFMRS